MRFLGACFLAALLSNQFLISGLVTMLLTFLLLLPCLVSSVSPVCSISTSLRFPTSSLITCSSSLSITKVSCCSLSSCAILAFTSISTSSCRATVAASSLNSFSLRPTHCEIVSGYMLNIDHISFCSGASSLKAAVSGTFSLVEPLWCLSWEPPVFDLL